MGSLELVTAPSVEPVSLDELKAHLRVDQADENGLLTSLIVAARRHLEMETRRAFINTTYAYRLPKFPADRFIELPRPPLSSVTSIVYEDSDSVSQTLAASSYQVDTYGEPGRVALEPSQSWPATEADRLNAVTVTYVAGYGSAATDVPQEIRQAIMLLAGHWYENREHTSPEAPREIPYGIRPLVWGASWGSYA